MEKGQKSLKLLDKLDNLKKERNIFNTFIIIVAIIFIGIITITINSLGHSPMVSLIETISLIIGVIYIFSVYLMTCFWSQEIADIELDNHKVI